LSGGGIKVKQKKDSSQIIKNFSLEGGKSSGKTLLLSLIAQTAVNHGYKVLYLDWVEIYNNFQTWDGAAENQRTLDAAKNCDLLCIDSIYNYSLNPTPSFVVLIDQIINHRIKNDLVTICSISASENSLPNLGPIWNQFLRENFTLKLPEATLTYENNTKRSRTKST
jgi:DNA replication protein DnaC